MKMMKMELLACSHQDTENGNKLFNIINGLAQTILTIEKSDHSKLLYGKSGRAMGTSLGRSVVEFGFKPSKIA